MKMGRISSVALVACAILGASTSLATTAQASSSVAVAAQHASAPQRPASNEDSPSCTFATANLHFHYWGPASDSSLVWSSTSPTSGGAVLLGNKKASSPLDCFKGQSFGGGVFAYQQYASPELCLNVAGNSKSSGAWIILYSCVYSPNERFQEEYDYGDLQLKSVSSGLCVDLGDGYNVLSHVEQKPCQSLGYKSQEWVYH